jgi:hypothetical protein
MAALTGPLGVFQLTKLVEDSADLFRGDARPGIQNINSQCCSTPPTTHDHPSSWRVAEGVFNKVAQDALQELWRKLGDDEVRKVAYRGRCLKPA